MRLFYNKNLIKKCLSAWEDKVLRNEKMTITALNLFNKNLKKRIVKSWMNYNEEQQKLRYRKNYEATVFYKSLLMKRSIKIWIKHIKECREEVLKEKRREEMYKKVQSLLPDFRY